MLNIILATICLALMTHNAIRIKDERLAWGTGALMALNWLISTVVIYGVHNP